VAELLSCVKKFERSSPETERLLSSRITQLTKFLPDAVKGSEFLCKFARDLKQDKNLMSIMEIIVSPTTDCKTCADNVVRLHVYLAVFFFIYQLILCYIQNLFVLFSEFCIEEIGCSGYDQFVLQYNKNSTPADVFRSDW